MPALQVRDFPQPLYDRLKQRADEDHRSMAQEVIFVVEGFLNNNPQQLGFTKAQTTSRPVSIYAPRKETEEEIQARIKKRERLFAEIAANPITIPDGFPSPEEIIRAIRDDREEELDARIAAFVGRA